MLAACEKKGFGGAMMFTFKCCAGPQRSTTRAANLPRIHGGK